MDKSEVKNFFDSCIEELSPIEVAAKLINAKTYVPEHTAFGITYEGQCVEIFDIKQLREIAFYLAVYCECNKEE